ncbi:MAG: hypothetical protein H6515_14750 [Microthrixaceae bacterium]|nr:hypothetical protein [Microthrixaceae bacterium]
MNHAGTTPLVAGTPEYDNAERLFLAGFASGASSAFRMAASRFCDRPDYRSDHTQEAILAAQHIVAEAMEDPAFRLHLEQTLTGEHPGAWIQITRRRGGGVS